MAAAERSNLCRLILPTLLFMAMFLSSGWAMESVFIRDSRFSMEVRALPLDAVDAFFLARGFSATDARLIAERGCVHKVAAAHDGDAEGDAVSVDLTTWQVRPTGGHWQPLALKETWTRSWAERKVSKPAQIAFHWALFPTHQRFHPGDRNWGMVPMGFVPGTTFDLKAVWHVKEKKSETILSHLQCASLGAAHD